MAIPFSANNFTKLPSFMAFAGFDKIRFLSPVRVGSRVRGHFELIDIRKVRDLEVSTNWRVEVEIENFDKPALVAQWIGRQYLSKGWSKNGQK